MDRPTAPPGRAGRPGQGKALARRNRGAPAGSGKVKTRTVKLNPSFWAKFRYRFDNALSRSPWVVIGYLGLLTLLIVMLVAAVAALASVVGFGGGKEGLGFPESFWQMLLRVVDAGTFSGDEGIGARLLALFVTLSGIFIAGSLIGLIASAVDQRVDALRRGRSTVLEKGHTLILGWSPRVPTIVSELVIANESDKDGVVVVLADMDKTEIEETLRTAVGDLKTTRIVGRRGDPSSMTDLELVAASEARSIVVMSGDESDAGAIKTSLAVLGLQLEDTPIIVEMEHASHADTLEAVTDGGVVTVTSDRLIAEVTAQACHERGLSAVFRELLDFDGDELYFREFPDLVGATYGQAQQSFDRAALLGLATSETVQLNPPPDRVIEAGERIVALVEDDSTFVSHGVGTVPAVTISEEEDPEPPQRILLVGWSPLAPRVIQELDEFLTPGSRFTILIDPELIDPAKAGVDLGLVNSTSEVRPLSGGPELLGEFLGGEAHDQGILLGYREGIAPGDADARTLLTLMALRQQWPKGQAPEVRLVAEVLDQRNVPIAELAGVDDFIVSDQLASLMLAQLSENVELQAVFAELFDASGASIVLRPSRRFSSNGDPRTFGEIVAAGNHFGESVIGYRVSAEGRVVLNPARTAQVHLAADDEVVVVTTR